jgi:hypothetical protein
LEETAAETGREIDFADGAISLTFGHSNSGASQFLERDCIIYLATWKESDLIRRFCPKNFNPLLIVFTFNTLTLLLPTAIIYCSLELEKHHIKINNRNK